MSATLASTVPTHRKRNGISRFFAPILVSPGYFFRNMGVSCLYASYPIMSIFFVRQITVLLEQGESGAINTIIWYFAGANLLYFIAVALTYKWGWTEAYYHHYMMIHREYMRRFNDLDNTYTESIGTGKIISILSKGIDTWTNLSLDLVSSSVRLIISLTGAFVIFYGLGSMYVLGAIALFTMVHIITYFLNEKALKWRNGRIDTLHEYDKQLVKMIMSKFEILQNNKIEREISNLDRLTDTTTWYNLRLGGYLVSMFSLPNLVFFGIATSVLVYADTLDTPFSVLISIFMVLDLLKERMANSIEFFKNFTKQIYSVQKLWKLFDDAPTIRWLDTGNDFQYISGAIEIQDLGFKYKDIPVFENFDLSIAGGKKTALVGLSGSGKSTLAKLISGYLSPDAGAVIVDGQALSSVKLRGYFEHIGYLTQEPSVFDGSIRENLCYGAKREVSDMELREAIKQAECDFIYEFKDWLDTEIGERGVRLSGGQRQRLAIAKIFIKNPEIIILDEPTSALDSFSEEKISQAFHNLFAWRTVIVIAHRLQTVKEADEIIVLDHGKIVERGTHASLSNLGGTYAKMLELQSWF